jgi:hypothetical protein
VASVEENPVVVFEDTFETDRGWTVQNGAGLTSGAMGACDAALQRRTRRRHRRWRWVWSLLRDRKHL